MNSIIRTFLTSFSGLLFYLVHAVSMDNSTEETPPTTFRQGLPRALPPALIPPHETQSWQDSPRSDAGNMYELPHAYIVDTSHFSPPPRQVLQAQALPSITSTPQSADLALQNRTRIYNIQSPTPAYILAELADNSAITSPHSQGSLITDAGQRHDPRTLMAQHAYITDLWLEQIAQLALSDTELINLYQGLYHNQHLNAQRQFSYYNPALYAFTLARLQGFIFEDIGARQEVIGRFRDIVAHYGTHALLVNRAREHLVFYTYWQLMRAPETITNVNFSNLLSNLAVVQNLNPRAQTLFMLFSGVPTRARNLHALDPGLFLRASEGDDLALVHVAIHRTYSVWQTRVMERLLILLNREREHHGQSAVIRLMPNHHLNELAGLLRERNLSSRNHGVDDVWNHELAGAIEELADHIIARQGLYSWLNWLVPCAAPQAVAPQNHAPEQTLNQRLQHTLIEAPLPPPDPNNADVGMASQSLHFRSF